MITLLFVLQSAVDFLPKDVSAFAELRNAGAIPAAVTAYVDRHAAEGKAADALQKINDAFDAALETLPEEARKKVKTRLLAVRGVAVAVPEFRGFDDAPRAVFVVEAANEKIAAAVLDEDLAPWISTSFRVGDDRVLRFDTDPAFFLARRGAFLIASTDLPEVAAALKRAPEDSIAAHPSYADLGAETSTTPLVRGFFDVAHMTSQSSLNDTRRDRRSYDVADAAVGWSNIRSVLFRGGVVDGIVSTRVETRTTGPVPALELLLGAEGDPDAWTYLPSNLVFGQSLRFDSAEQFRDRLKGFLDRIDTVVAESGDKPDGLWEEFERELAKEIGVAPNEFVDAAGVEVLLYMARDLEGPGGIDSPEGMGLIVRIKDRGKAERIVERLKEKIEGAEWTETAHNGVTILHADDGTMTWAYAITDEAFVGGMGVETVKAALDAHAAGDGFVKRAPAALMKSAHQTTAIRLGPVLHLVQMVFGMGGGGIDLGADLASPDAVDVTAMRPTEQGIEVRSEGCGGSSLIFSYAAWIPFVFARIGGYWGETPEAPEDTEPRVAAPETAAAEAYPLPDDADAFIRRQVRALRSEDAAERDEATAILLRVGRPATAALAEEAAKTGDPETKLRITVLIEAAGAYEALPELLEEKFKSLSEAIGREGISILRHGDIEPTVWDRRFKTEVVLNSPAGIERLAALLNESRDGRVRENAAGLLALYDSSSADARILELMKSSEGTERLSLLIASGWGSGAAIPEALASVDVMTRRAAFVAAERSASPAVADALFGLLDAADPETRFNAAFTLRRLTGGKINTNPFLPADERPVQAGKVRDWWKGARDGFRLQRASTGGVSMSMNPYATTWESTVPEPVEVEPEPSEEP